MITETTNQPPLTGKNGYRIFVFSCWLLYTVSVASKTIYSAEMVEITNTLGFTKTQASLPFTSYYLAYTLSQIVFAVIVRRINVRRFNLVTVPVSALAIISVAFARQLWQFNLLFALIGLTQSGIWAGVMYYTGKYIPHEKYNRVILLMAIGFSVGNASSYAFSSLFVAVSSWKTTFLFFGTFLLTALFLFNHVVAGKERAGGGESAESDREGKNTDRGRTGELAEMKEKKPVPAATVFRLATIMVIALLISIIYYAVSNWLPTLLHEVYGLTTSLSILFSILLPVCGILGVYLIGQSLRIHRNYFGVCAVFMLCAALFPLLLCFFYGIHILFAVVAVVVYAMLLRGTNNTLLSFVPLKLKSEINTGTSAAFINASATVGAAIAPLTVGMILDHSGWSECYGFLLAANLTAAVILGISSKVIHKRGKH